MKYIIVTIKRMNVPGKRMGYPAIYNAQEIEFNKKGPIVYEGALSRGLNTEECLISVQDSVADAYAAHPQGLVRIVTEAEADTWLGNNVQLKSRPEERVTDVDRLQAIQTKIAAGFSLSTEDNQALDPDHVMRGINRIPKTAVGIFGA